ncbi:MAG: serine hydroxymethyltransferase [Sedimentisphaerales bacterium]|nr:serine hydroxymethyltransferase [Sedimentisphaerales bacterium]
MGYWKYLEKSDPEVYAIIQREEHRQQSMLEMIASENHASPAVLVVAGSCLTNKYAEGLPGKRYYGGCEHIDEVETLAIERCKQLFGCEHANVQPHSGSQANMAVYLSQLEPGDTVVAMSLDHGGHLSHGMKLNFSGKFYHFVHYGVRKDTETIDYDQIAQLTAEHKPKLVVCGGSAYPREIDFPRIADIAHAHGAKVMADIAHISGLVAAGLHSDPVAVCEFVTSTTHKTLRGPRAGTVMCKKEFAKAINSAVFPGLQGGPLCHVIAAKAVAFAEAMTPEFKSYAEQIIRNCRMLCEELLKKGFRLVTGGSDNHLLLVDLRSYNADLTGVMAETWLHDAGIVVNKNLIPFDPRPSSECSGIRIGTPAVTTRGLKEVHMKLIADWIDLTLKSGGDDKIVSMVRNETAELARSYPLPG